MAATTVQILARAGGTDRLLGLLDLEGCTFILFLSIMPRYMNQVLLVLWDLPKY